MYQFTSYGMSVEDMARVEQAAQDEFAPTDLRHLPLWVAAAKQATEEGFCPEYDRLASALGGPNRSDLSQAGLLTRTFEMTLTRRVRVYGYVNQETTVEVEASSPAEAREQWENGDVDVEWEDYSHYDIDDITEDDEDVEIYRVTTA